MHITMLPSSYGIGTLGKEAEGFAELLQKAGQRWWQVLPIGPIGYGDSPYQVFSSFAGNPLLIDLDELCDKGMLERADCENADYGADPSFVDYKKVAETRDELLRKAYVKFVDDVAYTSFCRDESDWLDDYALFTAVKKKFGGAAWTRWDEDIKFRKPEALERYKEELKDEIRYVKWTQFIFFRQWTRFRGVCQSKGVGIIGDIPIYSVYDSADVWAHPNLFELDERLYPTKVAGAPPDHFSKTGQLWGNPLYNWSEMKKTGYEWWIKRIKKSALMFDMLRIGHFRMFDTYYTVPFGEQTAANGKLEQGPGIELFNAVKEKLKQVNIIADDMEDAFDSAKKLLRDCGFPGIRVLQFGFNPEYRDNSHLPHNYPKNSVCYTGTHDTATFMQWYSAAGKATRTMAKRYLQKGMFTKINEAAIKALYASPSAIAVIPVQDILGLGADSRMNIPSMLDGNWHFRLQKNQMRKLNRYAKKLKYLSGSYLR